LLEPTDIASLVYFRIVFGAIMVWECLRYFHYGWIQRAFIAPKFLFTYPGFDWVTPWPGDGMYYHFLALGILAFFMLAGFLYRISAILFFLAFTYVFLLSETAYLNHFYLVILISFIMIFVPAHRSFSVDAWMRKSIRSDWVPAWPLFLLRTQMGFVYFYAGIAKLNADWFQGYPMLRWINGFDEIPIIGGWIENETLAVFLSYSGLALDLFCWPALLWKPTRIPAFLVLTLFHLTNAMIFQIGIFPWFSIAITLLFFAPDWPRRVFRFRRALPLPEAPTAPFSAPQRLALVFVTVWVTLQVMIPLRPHFYDGNPSWTEEAHRFSWRQKLRSKRSVLKYVLVDPATDKEWMVAPEDILSARQWSVMAGRPEMIVQLAHYISELATEEGQPRVRVHAFGFVSLNGRAPQPLLDPAKNLADVKRTFFEPYDFIVPLEIPLSSQWDEGEITDPQSLELLERYKATHRRGPSP